MKVGILALQGDVAEHARLCEQLGEKPLLVKRAEELEKVKGLIIPGGESTTLSYLLELSRLREAILEKARRGALGILGTCAGAILLAQEVEGGAPSLALMNIRVKRNAFGRQKESFEINLEGEKFSSPLRGVFIRAPLITAWEERVKSLINLDEGSVLAQQGKFLACCFHPELTGEKRVHQLFLEAL